MYRPITIVLTTQSEARAFFGIIDKANDQRSRVDFTKDEIEVMVAISDWLSSCNWLGRC
jgi:hypothetical protein